MARRPSTTAWELPGTTGGSNPSLLLDQLWLKFDLNRLVYLTIGRQHAKWGASRFWNTVDYLIPQRLNPLALFDQRVGNDMVKVHVPIEAAGDEPVRGGLRHGRGWRHAHAPRWRGSPRRDRPRNGEYALSGRIEQDRPAQAGFDFSTALGPVDVRGELAVRWRPDRRLWRRLPSPTGSTIASQYEQVDPDRAASCPTRTARWASTTSTSSPRTTPCRSRSRGTRTPWAMTIPRSSPGCSRTGT